MKYLDFEKHIKNEFENSKEPVQVDALLASLDLGKGSKRKGFAFWIILPFLILTLSALAWEFVGTDNYKVDDSSLSKEVSSSEGLGTEVYNNIKSASVQKESTITLQDDDKSETNTETNSLEKNSIETHSVETNNAETGNSESKNAETSNTETSNAETGIAETNSVGTSNTETNNVEYGTPFTITKTEIFAKNKKTNSKTTSNNNRPPANNAQPIYKPQNSNSIQSGSIINESDLNTALTQPSASSTSVNSGYIGTPSATVTKGLSRTLLSIDELGRSIDKSIDLIDDNEVDDNLFSRMKINCPSFENPSWHMALIPEIGIFLPKKTLSQNSFEESADFLQRLESESTLEGIELGLYGMLVRDNLPFYLKAGLSYSRISERMNLEYEYIEKDTMLGIISTTVSGNGDTITHIYGDIVSETTFKGSNRQHHYIHLFDVPVSIGYTTYIAGLDVGIEGGIKVNFMTRATGNLLTSATEYTNLSLNRLFKNRIGISYFGGLMLGRNFGRFGDIYIAPRFNYYPNEFNNQNNNVSQKYFTIGLNAGVVYKIN